MHKPFLLFLTCANVALIFGTPHLRNEPPCKIEGMGSTSWLFGTYTFDRVDETHIGILKEFSCTDVKEVEIRGGKYLKAELNDNVLTISTTEEILNFELNEIGETVTEDFYVKCIVPEGNVEVEDDELLEKLEEKEDEEYTLKLNLPLKDINNHEPKFTKDEFVFTYYHDLPKTATLTEAQRVGAKDQDMSSSLTNALSFYIEKNDYFTVTTGRKDDLDKKLYYSIIKTAEIIKAPFEKSFTISVVDSGKPLVKSSTAKLTVKVLSEETLVFTETVYQAEIVDKTLEITNGPIVIEGGHDLGTTFEIISDDDIAENFEVKLDIHSISINIRYPLNQTIIDEREYLYITVVADMLGRVGHFAVMIKTGTTFTTTTEEPAGTTPSTGSGLETTIKAFEDWILGATILMWISFSILAIAFIAVIVAYKKLWQKKYHC